MLRIGLTGGIGSGKTTVAELFASHGVPVVDTDSIARELAQPGQSALREIVARFGPDVLNDSGHLDRARLRRRVFADATERKALESILHPRIRATVNERVAALNAPYCIIVIPLLVESGYEKKMVDRVLVVDCPEIQQISRVAARSQLTEPQIRAIMEAQATRAERLQHADDVIVNDGDLASLEVEVVNLHARYLELAASMTP